MIGDKVGEFSEDYLLEGCVAISNQMNEPRLKPGSLFLLTGQAYADIPSNELIPKNETILLLEIVPNTKTTLTLTYEECWRTVCYGKLRIWSTLYLTQYCKRLA